MGIRLLKRLLDSGFGCCFKGHGTSKKSINEYVNLYSGPELEIWFRYSAMLNFVFVTFTHGIAMPLLFPIGAFGMFNQYFFERILLARYYKQPPLFDERLNKMTVNLMRIAPLVMMAFGYWYLGNRQMFFNQKVVIDNKQDSVDSKHNFFMYTPGKVDHTVPILIFLGLMITQKVFIVSMRAFFTLIRVFKPASEFNKLSAYGDEALLVDEHIPKYHKALTGIE